MADRTIGLLAATVVALVAAAGAQAAERIDVSSYPVTSTSWPFAIAKEMNLFAKVGMETPDFITSGGGGNDVRNLMGGELAYADGSPGSVVSAVQSGADIKMVATELNNSVATRFAVLPNSDIKSTKDLKGKKIAYTSAQSVTQSLELWMLQKLGYKDGEVTLIAAGGFPQALVLLDHGGVDAAVVIEPTYSMNPDHYRVIAEAGDASIFPAFTNTVGIVSSKQAALKPDVIKKIIQARAMAVDFMNKNRKEAAAIIARVSKVDAGVQEKVLDQYFDRGTMDGVPSYSTGGFSLKAMENAVTMSRLAGAINGDVNVKSMIDTSYLPDNAKELK